MASGAACEVMVTPVGFWARGCTKTAATGSRKRLGERVERQALVVDRHAHELDAHGLEQVDQGREARVLDDDAVTEAQGGPHDEVERVHGAVDDGEVVDGIRPVGAERLGELGHDGVVEVAAGRRASEVSCGEDAAEARAAARGRAPRSTGRGRSPPRARAPAGSGPPVGRALVQDGGAAPAVGARRCRSAPAAPRPR